MVAVKLLVNLGLDGKAEKEEIEKLLGDAFLKKLNDLPTDVQKRKMLVKDLSGRLLVAKPSGTDAQKETVEMEVEPVVAVRLLVKLGLATFADKAEIEQLLNFFWFHDDGNSQTLRDFVTALRLDSYAKKQEMLEEELQLEPEGRGCPQEARHEPVEVEKEPVRARRW